MPLDFNGFQRELNRRGIDGPIAIMLTMIWEQVLELTKQGDEGAKIMLQMAQSMEGILGIQENLKHDTDALRRRLGADDAMVASVPLREED
ncbi:MAG TPA: hypothetical protein VIY48_13570 [Candidatus Paceibacterota bacterium]